LTKPQRALVLQGGGALGAYEVGVIKAIIEDIIHNNPEDDEHVFDIIAGSSIGAINGAFLTSHFLENNSWTKAAEKLEDFWENHIKSFSVIDIFPGFSQWWSFWHKASNGSIASDEAARRFYSSMQFYLFGAPNLLSSMPKSDNTFLNYPFNFLPRTDWTPFGDLLEEFANFPIKTNFDHEEPRLLTTAVDVKTGEGVIFDSYSQESKYGKDPEIAIEYHDGIQIEHVMASAAVPANINYASIKDKESTERMFWDGAFASNTPLRALMQHHRDYWHKIRKQPVPNLEVYIVGLWPSKKDSIPIPPDNNFVWDRMWDLIFNDKTGYVEKVSTMMTDHIDFIEKLIDLAEKNELSEEINKIKEQPATSKNRRGENRKLKDTIEGRFKIVKIHRIERDSFENASALKIYDFSQKTIKKLIKQGHDDAENQLKESD